MIISISGIDGSGKTTLIKKLAESKNFFVPEHVSKFVDYSKNLTQWYQFGNIEEVINLDLKGFKLRNGSVLGKNNVLLDRGHYNIIDSACARYQNRTGISYKEAKSYVENLCKNIGLNLIENKLVLLDFPDKEWPEVKDIINKRCGPHSESYLQYLEVLFYNIRSNKNLYDLILNSESSSEENLKKIINWIK